MIQSFDDIKTIEATDGNGRIDFEFSDNGSVKVNRIYTGGVTRYADLTIYHYA